MTYSNADTVVYQAHGSGAVSEAVALLDDSKMQYALFRIPVDSKSGEIEVKKVRDIFVAWTGPKVGVIEKGRKKIHIGKMAAFLKPSHAELQAVNRQLLTEDNLLYCSDPHGAHIIDYDATTDPKARSALLGDVSKQPKLKKADQVKDASAPAIDPHLKVDLKENPAEKLTKEIESGDKKLKHTTPTHDASAPAIDPHLKVDVKAGKQRKEALKGEIAKGAELKHVTPVHDASAPAVPEPIKCPESAQIKELIGKLFNKSSQRGFVLLGYKDKNTIGLEASGTGSVGDVVPKLADDKIQYFLVRIPIGDTQGEVHASTVRDVMVVWTGPKVGVIEKAKKKIDFGGVAVLLSPHASSLQAVQKELLTEQNLAYCSDPHAGTHIIDYQAVNDPKVKTQLKAEITQGAKLKPVEHTVWEPKQ